ncbi:alpha/beta fold hydrolase [Chitinophaga sp. 22321]|uniref:Alpha/beta hydrolase n=1 Tax=Chitinophaga hostae TaxID=2831022 RepID=A0ABS5J988_9BACT|nr:alpha/beta hydrolase [Chitinophaga hostae]MBS0031773.1 alpha/beta hydrolase [Chitinophaga hostae]
MRIETFLSKDGIPLEYYVFGHGPRRIMINNSPGMSIKFWIPIINNFPEDEYTIIGMEYRGFPKLEIEIPFDQCSLELIVDDCLQILEREQVDKVHLFSWCVGAKAALSVYERIPDRICSINALNCAYRVHDLANPGTFTRLMYAIKSKIKRDDSYIPRMIKIMKEVGDIPKTDFLEIMGEQEAESPSYELYKHLDDQSPLAGLAFYLIDNYYGLVNYLNIYENFGKKDVEPVILGIKCPFNIINGELDTTVKYEERDFQLIRRNSNVSYADIEKGAHFMMIDFPRRVFRKLKGNLDLVGI